MRRLVEPPRLPPRARDANKASVGTVLVAGGSVGMAGAPALAALGALRAGAGLVRVAVPRSIQPTVAALRAEATTAGLPEEDGGFGAGAVEALLAAEEDRDAVVVGPGAGRAERTLEALRTFCLRSRRPLVIDADALFAWNGRAAELAARAAPTVLTPHEGEAARLLGVEVAAIRAEREANAVALARAARAVVVLKGPETAVADGDRIYRNRTGGPALATAGTGDVLAGMVGALLAAGLSAFDAACAAVHAHGSAADRLARVADRGHLASDVAAEVPAALATLVGPARGTTP